MRRPAPATLGLVAALLMAPAGARADDEADDDEAAREELSKESRSDATALGAFRAQSLTYDPDTGGAFEGIERRHLDARELYVRLGRQDLVEKADARDRERSAYLFVGGGALLAGAAGVVVAYATAPDLNGAPCTSSVYTYNACIGTDRAHQLAGTVAAAAGGVLGLTLIFRGLGMSTTPISHGEAASLVQTHNGATLRSLRSPRPAPAAESRLRLAPQLGPQGGGLFAFLTF